MKKSSLKISSWVSLLAVIGLVSAARLWLADLPLDRDEGFFAVAGQLILSGRPMLSAVSFRFFLVYPIYAIIFLLLGQTAASIHIALTLVNAASMALVFKIARRFCQSHASLFAALSFGLAALNPGFFGTDAFAA